MNLRTFIYICLQTSVRTDIIRIRNRVYTLIDITDDTGMSVDIFDPLIYSVQNNAYF